MTLQIRLPPRGSFLEALVLTLVAETGCASTRRGSVLEIECSMDGLVSSLSSVLEKVSKVAKLPKRFPNDPIYSKRGWLPCISKKFGLSKVTPQTALKYMSKRIDLIRESILELDYDEIWGEPPYIELPYFARLDRLEFSRDYLSTKPATSKIGCNVLSLLIAGLIIAFVGRRGFEEYYLTYPSKAGEINSVREYMKFIELKDEPREVFYSLLCSFNAKGRVWKLYVGGYRPFLREVFDIRGGEIELRWIRSTYAFIIKEWSGEGELKQLSHLIYNIIFSRVLYGQEALEDIILKRKEVGLLINRVNRLYLRKYGFPPIPGGLKGLKTLIMKSIVVHRRISP